MLQGLAIWRDLSPFELGWLFFFLGLVAGSFCSVVRHRIPLGWSLVAPGSRCPTCLHPLRVRDMVPVLSFIWLRGRCRHCRMPISPTYLVTEVVGGLLAGMAAATQGWGAGILALLVWVVGNLTVALFERRYSMRDESGFTLTEVLISTFLLAVALLPALDATVVALHAGAATQKRVLTVGLARARLGQFAQIAAMEGVASLDDEPSVVTGDQITGNPDHRPYTVSTVVTPIAVPDGTPGDATSTLRKVSVVVSCAGCAGRMGLAVSPITLTSVLRENVDGE